MADRTTAPLTMDDSGPFLVTIVSDLGTEQHDAETWAEVEELALDPYERCTSIVVEDCDGVALSLLP